MRRILNVLTALLVELRRRKVFRVIAAYSASAFIVLQVAQLTFEPLGLPALVYRALVVLVILGFPVTALLAWAFDVTPSGFERTPARRAVTTTAASPDASSDTPTAASLDVAKTTTTTARSRQVAWAGLLVLAVASTVGGYVAWRLYRDPPMSAETVAVLPFSVRGSSAVEYLGEGMVDLLSRNLDGVRDLRAIAAGMVLSVAAKQEPVSDPGRGRELARELGAGLYVMGNVFMSAGTLRIDAALYESGDGALEPRHTEQVQGDTAALFALVDELSAKLLAAMRRGHGAQLARTAAMTSRSLAALKEYLTAEQSLRRAAFDSASIGFERALAIDSTFALAHYRLAVAAFARDRYAVARRATSSALQHATELGLRERRLIEGFDAFLDGRAYEAERIYRTLLRDHPDDMEATHQLAEVLVQYNPMRGRSVDEATALYERVMDSDPEFLCPI